MKDREAKREYDRARYQKRRDEFRAQRRAWYLANREEHLARVKARYVQTYVPHPRVKAEPKPRVPKFAWCRQCGTKFEKRGRQFYCSPEHRPVRDYSNRVRVQPIRVAPPPRPPRVGPVWVPQPVSVWERGLDYVWQA